MIRQFQERMPYGLFVPDVPLGTSGAPNVLPKRSPHLTRQNHR